jgi:hypothetical protein
LLYLSDSVGIEPDIADTGKTPSVWYGILIVPLEHHWYEVCDTGLRTMRE